MVVYSARVPVSSWIVLMIAAFLCIPVFLVAFRHSFITSRRKYWEVLVCLGWIAKLCFWCFKLHFAWGKHILLVFRCLFFLTHLGWVDLLASVFLSHISNSWHIGSDSNKQSLYNGFFWIHLCFMESDTHYCLVAPSSCW